MSISNGDTTTLQVGCQTYTWEMLGDRWTGSADDLLAAIAGGGYAGIEITDNMIGRLCRPAGRVRRCAGGAWAHPRRLRLRQRQWLHRARGAGR